METGSTLVFFVGLIIFAAHLFTAIFERTRIPDVLPLIFIGIFVGPIFGLLEPTDLGKTGQVLSAVALALMLFEGGSHLTLDTLRSSLKDSVVLALTTFVLTVLIATGVAHYLMGIEIKLSLFIGAVLGSISPAVVVPIVRMLDLSDKTKSTLVVESAITDVLSIIIALGILKTLSTDQKLMQFIGTDLIAPMAMSLLLGFGGAVIWSTILEKIRKFPNTIFTSLAFIFLLYGSAEILAWSGPIAVLIFGIVLANSNKIPLDIVQRFGADHLTEFTSIEKRLFSEVIFLVKTFFFIYLGMSIQFGYLRILFFGMILTGFIYLGRLILCRMLTPKNTPISEASMMSFIIPKGLAAAVLAEVPMHIKGLADKNPKGEYIHEIMYAFEEIRATIYIVILFSILLTAFLIYAQETGLTRNLYDRYFSKFNTDH